jgi:Gram-negative bacterial TonB protein C-terminal
MNDLRLEPSVIIFALRVDLMFHLRHILGFCLAFAVLSLSTSAQDSAIPNKEFSKDGLTFSYPTNWTLTDQSNELQQYLALTRSDSTLVIAVIASRTTIKSFDHFSFTEKKITEPYIRSLAENFGAPAHPADRHVRCQEVAFHRNVEGVELKGLYHNEPSTAAVYSFVLGGRFVTLVYLHSEKASVSGDIAWEAVHKSLKVRDQNLPANSEPAISDLVDSGFLKALLLPFPDYPTNIMHTRPNGTVVMQVFIDETGKVASTKLISGSPVLMLAAFKAAHASKFAPPLLCGQPVTTTGVLLYRFTGPKMQN